MSSEGPTFGINWKIDSPEKNFSVNYTKANTKFSLNLDYNADNIYLFIYLFINGKEISKFKADNKNVFTLEEYLIDLVVLRLKSIFKWKCTWFFSRLQFY